MKNTVKKKAEGLLRFIEKSPTAFHAVREFSEMLKDAGFLELSEGTQWKLLPGRGYFVTRNGSSLIAFRLPEDSAENKLIVSVHYYGPWDYCGTKAVNQWGSPLQYKEQNETLAKMTKFTERGYGVIIGEYGVLTDGKATPKPDTSISAPAAWSCRMTSASLPTITQSLPS